MEKRRLGKSDLYVSSLALGCMSLGTDENQAANIIQAALEEGINYFDTADLYDYGVNEAIVGKTLAPQRDQVIIATKVGNRWNDTKSGWYWDPSKAYIKEAVKNSLRRLQTDYIDLYQLHGGTIEDRIDETIEAFEELKSEGLIREYGISSIRPNVIRRFIEDSSIVNVMMQYSLLDRRPEETMSALKEHQISVVTRGSVAKGLLSDRTLAMIEAGEDFAEKGYLDYTHTEIKQLLESVKAKIRSRSMTEIALQFNLKNETVAAVVTGASSVKQIQANAKAVQAPLLTDEELTVLQSLTKTQLYAEHR
ncbi:aldo/keto reductase [Bacillus sp. FJAT-50079]|uniref:aldo/keto reductase n=1 Tax=Bacillus sp. FJAT-50079 TaxID=2833577 RepID=UPI001BCA64A5|nr:aldo/keto reductase [Bacillus sp. FJAT-50079]MBS4209689.1 aldo/keto reductase [Bacillus sp. FJAT-50079]